jgi:hypothetical protein
MNLTPVNIVPESRYHHPTNIGMRKLNFVLPRNSSRYSFCPYSISGLFLDSRNVLMEITSVHRMEH